MCGTTASLCGLESASSPEEEKLALDCILMLHAWMLTQSGIPVLHSGDEIAQLNDYSYHDDPTRREDSRFVHRGRFRWDLAELRKDPSTPQGQVLQGLRQLERIRSSHDVFRADAEAHPFDTGSDQVLGLYRSYGGTELVALFNFSEEPRWIRNPGGGRELRTDAVWADEWIELSGYSFVWLYRDGSVGSGEPDEK